MQVPDEGVLDALKSWLLVMIVDPRKVNCDEHGNLPNLSGMSTRQRKARAVKFCDYTPQHEHGESCGCSLKSTPDALEPKADVTPPVPRVVPPPVKPTPVLPTDETKILRRYKVKVKRHEILVCRGPKKAGRLWFDTGCRRCVSGPQDHEKMTKALALVGLKPLKVEKREQFIFGDAKTAESDCAFAYPAFQNNLFAGLIDIARVPVPCPGLFSLKMAKRWHCQTDHKAEQVIVKKYDRIWPFQNGTPVINVLDYDPDHIDFTDVPPEFFID